MKRCTILLAIVGLSAVAWAVQPVTTEHTTEADFEPAESEQVTVWSLGEVTLGAAAETVLADRDDVAAVTATVVAADGTVYVGTATEGLILRVAADGAISKVADLDSAVVSDLLLDGDRLLAATAGDAAGVYAIDLTAAKPAGAVTALWSDEDATSVWAIALTGETVYAATAPNGKLFAINAAGEGEAIFTATQKVLRSVLAAGKVVYVGTSKDGLVYRIDLNGGKPTSRVLLDAEEAEIVALVRDGQGYLYAAGTNVTPAAAVTPAASDGGRPASRPTTGPAATASEPTTQPTTQPTTRPADPAGGAPTADTTADEPTAQRTPASTASPATQPASAQPAVLVSLNAPARAVPAQMMPATGSKPPSTARPTGRASGRTAAGSKKGNTIYRIDAGGMTRAVGKIPAMILAMGLTTRPTPRLVVATAAGEVRVIDLANGAGGALAKLDPKKITTVAAAADGAIYVGTAEPALVACIARPPVTRGTLVSKPIDAKQIARWGAVHVRADVPDGAGVTLATRTGNITEPTDETWSSWSAEIPVVNGWSALGSPAGRLLQYRLTLTRTAAGGESPVVDSVRVVHQVGNLPPEIEAVEVTATERAQKRSSAADSTNGALRYRAVAIKAADPNKDPLRFDLFYQQRGSTVWIRWAEDVTSASAVWDTRTAADGVYEIKVVATDAAANPPAAALTDERIFRAVIVDNTSPRIAEVGTTIDGPTVRLTGTFTDVNRIRQVQYRVDSDETAVAVAAADGIFDAPTEKISVALDDLDAGPHAITVKVVDEFGNAAYTTVTVTIAE